MDGTPHPRNDLNSTKSSFDTFCRSEVRAQIQNENSVPLQEALEPHYIHYIVAKGLSAKPIMIRNCHPIATQCQLNDIATQSVFDNRNWW